MAATCAESSVRITRAGAPMISECSGNCLPSVITDPAPTMLRRPIRAPFITIEPIPTSAPPTPKATPSSPLPRAASPSTFPSKLTQETGTSANVPPGLCKQPLHLYPQKKSPCLRGSLFPVRPFVHSGKQSPLACGDVALDVLAKKFGTPLYVYSGDHIRHRLGLFTEAFSGQPHMVCYAVKANSALAILKLLAEQGAGFDIVSGGELERVLAVDRAASARVVFSGVGKTAPEIDLALRSGILLFNVESEGELELLAERATRLKKLRPFNGRSTISS